MNTGGGEQTSGLHLTEMRERAERVLAVEDSGLPGTASGLREWARDVLALLDELEAHRAREASAL